MPRQPRIDAPDMVHHIVVRGIERRQIFIDDRDRNFFLGRLADLVLDTKNPLYTFALIPNHFHLLIRRGKTPISTLMQRLLTSYALYFNKRHSRSGHLFQNRYKSYFCKNDTYFTELLRYINLNPVRAGLCSFKELGDFRYAGHSYIMGKRNSGWLDSDAALLLFGGSHHRAREAYAKYIVAGLELRGGITDGTSGKQARKYCGCRATIESSSEGMDTSAASNTEDFLFESRSAATGKDEISRLFSQVGLRFGVTKQEIDSKSKTRRIVLARMQLAREMSKQLGLTRSEIARQLAVNPSAVSKMLCRGENNQDS